MTPGLGPVQSQRLLEHFSTPLAIDQCSASQLAALIPKALCEGLLFARGPAVSKQINEAIEWASATGQTILTPDQANYPALLKHTADAPLVLYAKGQVKRLTQPALAIVGARNGTPDGLDHAREFAHCLAEQGWCIVSGLAHGIDAAAHHGAIEAGVQGGGTIAVFGTGADLVYPRNHAHLVKKLLESDGLILSEFPLGTPARPHHFPRRNRIVAGLARGVLVVEAAIKSGSLLTAKFAVELDREVFAIPGSIRSPLSRGPHALIQDGAKLVECGADILNELSTFSSDSGTISDQEDGSVKMTASLQPPAPLSPVWDAIGYDPVTLDVLQQRTNMLPAILQCELLTLELNGDIERRPNGRIVRSRLRS